MWKTYVDLRMDGGAVLHAVGTPLRIGSSDAAGEARLLLRHADVAPVHAVVDVDPDNAHWRVFVRAEECEVALLNGFPLYRPQPVHAGDVIGIGPFGITVVDAGVLPSSSSSSRISFLLPAGDVAARLQEEVEYFIREALRPPPAFYELQREAKEAEAAAAATKAAEQEARLVQEQQQQQQQIPRRSKKKKTEEGAENKKKKRMLISRRALEEAMSFLSSKRHSSEEGEQDDEDDEDEESSGSEEEEDEEEEDGDAGDNDEEDEDDGKEEEEEATEEKKADEEEEEEDRMSVD